MSPYKPCPKCSSPEATKVGFTWWGGILGPSLLTHVKCDECGTAYNGKTGQSNTVGIIIYSLAGVALAIVILIALVLTRK
jgi:hypothetical protein